MASTDTANQAILDRLSGMAGFHPASANLFADWTLDPGDVVTVRQGETNYRLPVYQMDIDWKGKSMVSVKSTGSEKRPTLPAMKRSGYGGRAQTQMEREMVIHKADIDKSNEKLSLWATEEEWSNIAGEYRETHRSQFDITSRGISSIVTGVDAGNFSVLQSYAVGDVVLRYGKLYRFIDPHSPGAWDYDQVVEIADVYEQISTNTTRIDQDEDSISLVVGTSSGGKFIKRGNIFAALNEDSTATAGINADKVILSSSGGSSITLSDKAEVLGDLSISGGDLHVGRDTTIAGDLTLSQSSSAYVGNLYVEEGGVMGGTCTVQATSFLDITGAVPVDLTSSYIDVIKTESGNSITLTFTTAHGDTKDVTFSRATTLSGAWSGGGFPYTVSASPQGNQHTIGFGSYGSHNLDLEIRANGAVSKSSSAYSVDVPITLNSLNSGQTAPTSRYTKSLTVSVSGVLESRTTAGTGKITANGTYYPNQSNYVGFSAVEVDVSGGGGNPQSSKTITASIIGSTVTPDTGYDSMEEVVISRAVLGTRQSTLPASEASKVISGTIDSNGFWPLGDGYLYAYFSGQGTPGINSVTFASVSASDYYGQYGDSGTYPESSTSSGGFYLITALANDGTKKYRRFRT